MARASGTARVMAAVIAAAVVWTGPARGADDTDARGPDSRETAAGIDRLIADELRELGIEPAPRIGDGDFLRRAMFDLAGTAPSPQEVSRFERDADPDKRAKLIDRLLESDGFARNVARYWRDVIFTRATDLRARLAQGTFETWMTEQLREGRTWDAIATELLTAAGDVRENGATSLIFAHGADAAELAGEVSRIFLGIQLQCANCHDHPSDSWTREQFHELAAYFPRMRVRQVMTEERRSFEVVSVNVGFGRGRPFPGRGGAEHFMADPSNPASRGRQVNPAFFVNGTKARPGLRDLDRRQALARTVTSPENPWFATAFVNRVWGELAGEGFYTPIDDLGPEREVRFPQALERLRDDFIASGYDIGWLYRTVANTETYQRELRPRDLSGETPPFVAAAPTRLRADQIYNALNGVLGLDQAGSFRGRQPGGGFGGPFGRFGSPRVLFGQLFGYDPSTPQEDLVGSVPQALFMMNSPLVNAMIRAEGNTRLARILREHSKDEEVVRELYLLALSRGPSANETSICLDYVKDVGNRREAFEDLLWTLVNSSEFLTKR